jgi:hypothetical protein
MRLLRSARALSVIALFAMIVTIVAPFAPPTPMAGHDRSFVAASLPSTMDCDACPKAMALGGCLQVNCQMAATETEYSHPIIAEAISYAPLAMTPPAEWHIVPPVSPG